MSLLTKNTQLYQKEQKCQMSSIYQIYLGFGGNLLDTEKIINEALEELCANDDIRLVKASSFWQTEPQGDKNQSWFTNSVVLIECHNLPPHELLKITQQIELDYGRKRQKENQNAPRTLDIDLLSFLPPDNPQGHEDIHSDCLTIPHPRMFTRAFVLIPLQEISPDYTYCGKSIQDYLKEVEYTLDEKKIFQND